MPIARLLIGAALGFAILMLLGWLVFHRMRG